MPDRVIQAVEILPVRRAIPEQRDRVHLILQIIAQTFDRQRARAGCVRVIRVRADETRDDRIRAGECGRDG